MTENAPHLLNAKPENSFLNTVSGLELIRLQHTLKRFSQRHDEIPKMAQPLLENYAQLGTGSFLINTVTETVMESIAEDTQTKTLIKHILEVEGKKRFWGDTDVRGCIFTVLLDKNKNPPTISAQHIRFNTADTKSELENQFRVLVSPFSDVSDLEVHLVGGLDEATSIDTLASFIHKLQKTFTKINYKTIDILNKNQTQKARRPVFDTKTQKMFYIEPPSDSQ